MSLLKNLTPISALSRGDNLYVERDPAGTPLDRRGAIEAILALLPKLDSVTLQSEVDSAAFFQLKNTAGTVLLTFDTINDLLTVTGEQFITSKLDIGLPGNAGGIDVGEGGSTQLDLVAYTYDASASSGSRFTVISDLDANNTLLGDIGDRLYIGVQSRTFWGVRFDVGIASSAESQFTTKYWNGALVSTKHMGINKASAVRTGSTIMESVITEYVVWDRHVRDDWVAIDNQLDAIPNTGVARYWISIEVGGTNLVTPPRVDEIKVRGSDFDIVSGDPPHVVLWGRSRYVQQASIIAATLQDAGANPPAQTDIDITSDLNITSQRFDNDKELPFLWIIPENADTSCPLNISVDYSATDGGGIDVELICKILTDGTAIDSGQSGSITFTKTITPSAADTMQIAKAITSPGNHVDISLASPGDIIAFQIRRDASDANSGLWDLFQINIEYVSWQLGAPA